MYHEILVPTDGSEESATAVDQAVAVASHQEARVHFLYVVDVGEEMSASGVGTIADDLTETYEQEAEDALDAAATRADEADVTYERATLEGVPHEAITQYSDEHDIDLIVVGASGRTGLAEHLLGSTTDRVVRSADASVLVARD
ncbi:universal stress protein [Halorussus salinisoli]|uniref:universal stress protein n=1 Tax=Halorussus salinisoli TaxID=2558242 RepID=UPI0010C16E26|nr:universal stress protein [Halorussus salinisoli]